MKTGILVLTLILLFPLVSNADSGVLLDERGLEIILEDMKPADGGYILSMKCVNKESYNRNITLTDLKISEKPASFKYGWGTELISLNRFDEFPYELFVEHDDHASSSVSVSFRFLEGGIVSSPAVVSFFDDSYQILKASFLDGQEEPLLFASCLPQEPSIISPIHLTDKLDPKTFENLDEALLRIAVETETEEEKQYMPITTIAASVDTERQVRGDYSGLTVIFSDVPDVPLQIVEINQNAKVILIASGISLTGEAIYYAELSFNIEISDGVTEITDSQVLSDEMGGKYIIVPAALFTSAKVSQQLFRIKNFGSELLPVECGNVFGRMNIGGPLTPQIIPAEKIGPLYAWFEYYLTDGSFKISEPFPLRRKPPVE